MATSDPSELNLLRAALDTGYRLCGWLSAFFIILILAVVIGQVFLNIVDAISGMVAGQAIRLLIPSYADLSGFFLAAGTFFGMAYTFRTDGHIRVNLVISRLPKNLKRVTELICLGTALCVAILICNEAFRLAYDSWIYGDSSYGLIAIPIWLPQSSFVLGTAAFAIAITDALVTSALGNPFGEVPAPQAPNAAE